MNRSIAIFLSLISLSIQTNAANFFMSDNPNGAKYGYLLFGNITASDVTYIPNVGSDIAQVLYTPVVGRNSWEAKINDIECPDTFSSSESQGKQKMAEIWNSRLAKGIYLDTKTNIFSGQSPMLLSLYCNVTRPGYNGLWMIQFPNIPVASRPPETPRCTATVQPTINFGNVIIGDTAELSTQGIISCDNDTRVKVSFQNPGNAPGKEGILRLGDATVIFNVDRMGSSKEYSVYKNINEPFTLNFKLSDTGKLEGKKQEVWC